jgi:hypothetical protein
MVTKFNKIFSGAQPHQLVAGRIRHFGNHLCPRQGSDVTGYPEHSLYRGNGDRDDSWNVGFFPQPTDAAVCPRRFYWIKKFKMFTPEVNWEKILYTIHKNMKIAFFHFPQAVCILFMKSSSSLATWVFFFVCVFVSATFCGFYCMWTCAQKVDRHISKILLDSSD